jgi:elongation factor 1-beta
MGDVICVYRVMPEGPDDFDRVKKALEAMEPNRLEEEPVAFGLVALRFTKIIPDGPGDLEGLEKRLNGIEGAGSVENIRTSRAM